METIDNVIELPALKGKSPKIVKAWKLHVIAAKAGKVKADAYHRSKSLKKAAEELHIMMGA